MAEILIPYSPRGIWKDGLHDTLRKYRYAVIVAHRRFGKTTGMLNHLIREALMCDKLMPVYALIGPFRNQMKKIAWEPLKHYTWNIPGRKVNESDMYIELPSRYPGQAAGARIYILGADNEDSIRGLYFDGVIMDEYADMSRSIWTTIVMPAIQDREGYCYFIG